ncbi:MAG TPA: hypothetical protein VKX17_07375 [Planctomycetota bacterium]|nr:hypothetical protein [Planctomycetota bacterium]
MSILADLTIHAALQVIGHSSVDKRGELTPAARIFVGLFVTLFIVLPWVVVIGLFLDVLITGH